MLIYPSGSSSYTINKSLRFRASATAYLNRTPAGAGNLQTWTWSGWVKRGTLGTTQVMFSNYNGAAANGHGELFFDANNCLNFAGTDNGSTNTYNVISTQVFRDTSAWYHLTLVFDTTNATSSERIRIYLNGLRIAAFTTATLPTQNYSGQINRATSTALGALLYTGGGFYLDGYLAEVNFIDGQALTPSSFGKTDATTGVWQPIKYTGTYGTNGFYLQFADTTAFGKDSSGNSNTWTSNNISNTAGVTYDAMIDSPTMGAVGTQPVGNYCVLNPLTNYASATVSNGNLNYSIGNGSSFKSVISTMVIPSTGKYYFEFTGVTVETGAGTGYQAVGISDVSDAVASTNIGNTANSYGYFNLGYKSNNGTNTAGYGATWTTGDVIGCAVDMDAGTIVFYKNNTSQGTAYSSLSATKSYTPAITILGTTSNIALNCGQRPFTYTPPTGFKALCTTNLPDSTIVKGNKYMDATTYTGNGATQNIVNQGQFKPDFVWVKDRTTTFGNILVDSVRGVNNYLASHLTQAETTQAGSIISFNSNGFGVGNWVAVNTNTDSLVAWQWQAGQGTTSSNTSGSITSTVSVNTTAGFSVVTYTGTGANATVGHGLGVAPKMVIVKNRTGGADGWPVYNSNIGAANFLALNTTAASTAGATVWNSTAPTSTVFSIGTSSGVNTLSSNYVAYCFAEVAGFSKFGSYTGNGSADGPFVYCGFRPKFVMFKCSAGATIGSWTIIDTSRNSYNLASGELEADLSAAEGVGGSTNEPLDILSNGFKLRGSGVGGNGNGNTYIYMAFAESPFKVSLAR